MGMRLFVAVELSDEMKAALGKVQRSLSRFDQAVRWTGKDQMHLTLKFLGEVPDEDVMQVCSATERIAAASAPFETTLAECGCFPPRGPVRVVWAGLAVSGKELADCQRLGEQAYAELGFEPERRAFTPHLTLGRVREGKRADGLREVAAAARPAPAGHYVEEICVFHSKLGRDGAQHTVISRHPLRGTSPSQE
jgi:2'-5' RNA ligase